MRATSAGVAAGRHLGGRRQRRFFLVIFWLAACLPGCGQGTPRPAPENGIDRSLAAAQRFLIAQQAPDGAWRSDVYGQFKDGDALTPLALLALLESGDQSAACDKGLAYLSGLVLADGTIDAGPYGVTYPVYTAAVAVRALSRRSGAAERRACAAWVAYLRERQLTEDLGWQPDDQEYGGWGFAHDRPRKPGPGDLRPALTESNLSATVFALDALRAAKCPGDDPVLRKALTFVQRCQNFSDAPAQGDAAFDDGGFFFIYDDAVRNKAGPAGMDRHGRERFHSYGSTTADGLRALLACGLPRTHLRVTAARTWLEKNFRADANPGAYAPASEATRDAVYFYYCWSLSQALRDAGVIELHTPTGPVRWQKALADALIERQQGRR